MGSVARCPAVAKEFYEKILSGLCNCMCCGCFFSINIDVDLQ